MAVRRISDLPNLMMYYPDATLSSSLMEVSYAKPNPEDIRRYQSFYATLNEIMILIVQNMQRASKSQFGIVKIGNNIDVVENDPTTPMSDNPNGTISVKTASYNDLGVVKIKKNVGLTIASGELSISKASTSNLGVVKIGDNIQVDTNSVISVNKATKDDYGVVKVTTTLGDSPGLKLRDGVLSLVPQAAAGITVTPKTDDGDIIATITVGSETPKDIHNGIDINSLSSDILDQVMAGFMPNYQACQLIKIPCGNYSDASIGGWNNDGNDYFPTCRVKFNCNAYVTLGICYGINLVNSALTRQSGIAKRCGEPIYKVSNLSLPVDETTWVPLPEEINYCTGYFVPKDTFIYVKGPKFHNGGETRDMRICPLGTETLRFDIEVRRKTEAGKWQSYAFNASYSGGSWTDITPSDWNDWCNANSL